MGNPPKDAGWYRLSTGRAHFWPLGTAERAGCGIGAAGPYAVRDDTPKKRCWPCERAEAHKRS